MCAMAQACGGQRAIWESQFCLSTLLVPEIILSLLDLASVYALSLFAGLGKCFKWKHIEECSLSRVHSLLFFLLSRSWCLMVAALPHPQVTSSRSRW